MQIVSIIKDSFQEYEGEHSLVLFSKGCNLNCYRCYNYDQVNCESIGDAINIIDKNITPLHSAVVLLGGEPTIHYSIDEVCEYIKNKELKVKLYTNGILPVVIERLVKSNLLDSISIDLKGVANIAKLTGSAVSDESYLGAVKKSITAARDINIEVRTTIFDISDKESVEQYMKTNFPDIRHIFQKEYVNSRI